MPKIIPDHLLKNELIFCVTLTEAKVVNVRIPITESIPNEYRKKLTKELWFIEEFIDFVTTEINIGSAHPTEANP